MSIGIQIDVRDTASPAVQRFIGGLSPAQLNPVVGHAARNVFVAHFRVLNTERPNQLFGPRTNFYLGAANATAFSIVGDYVVVSIAQVGIAQRFFGGTIKPVTAKYLTIPARSESYGRRASEFTGLRLLWGKDGPFALAIGDKTVRTNSTARLKNGNRVGLYLGEQADVILFWLEKEVTQQPDPTVLPTDAELAAGIKPALVSYATRLWQRAEGAPPNSGGTN